MDWDIVLQYVPEGVCAVLCIFGCLCNWVRTGSIKTAIEKLCPSLELVYALTRRVDMLEMRLDVISQTISNVLGCGDGGEENADTNSTE